MKKDNEPSVFDYLDYRKFLKDLYKSKKAVSGTFSHRVFVRKCGFSSPNFLKLVMDGKRDLGKNAKAKIIQALCKRQLEKDYLDALISFEQAKTNNDRSKALDEITRIQHRTKVRDISTFQYEYLSKWYYVALRELVMLDDFKEDPAWINKTLGTRLAPNTITNIIEKLTELGFLTRDKNKRLKQVDKSIVCDPKIFSSAVINYHKEMIEKSKESIDVSKSIHRDISGVTFPIDQDTFEKIRKKIHKFRQEIHAIASSAEAHDAVYQFNFQLFNLTEVKW
ncbi:MAG: TIGR02147 family protein [Deltaproteobacteria bacterium]|nr:TIGR02147 family protein [Deltaproteobacteria bacterium]